MRPSRAVASFDSASAMLRALARFLHGRDVPMIGQLPPPLEPAVAAGLSAVNRLPRRAREEAYSWSGWVEAIPRSSVGEVDAERVARWVVDHYPARRYPAVLVGSSNGAAVHLAAALGVPWLPQTLLVPVRQRGVHPDDPAASLTAGVAPGGRLLAGNPRWVLHHMHDANQDRLMIRRMTYFRVKWRQLPTAYRDFLRECLDPDGTVVVLDCGLRWPTVAVADRHRFQHGALGGASVEEYQHGGERVAAFLARYGSPRRRWEAPIPDAVDAEAEWGFDRALLDDLAGSGRPVACLRYDDPHDLSPLVADLYRQHYARHGLPTDRLLVETFLLVEPFWALRTASVPFWAVFSTDPSVAAVDRYLDAAPPFDEIRVGLFSHGVESIGLAPIGRWRALLARAGRIGAFVGVDDGAYPRDFASFAAFHRDLAAIRTTYPLPPPLALTQLEAAVRSAPTLDWVS